MRIEQKAREIKSLFSGSYLSQIEISDICSNISNPIAQNEKRGKKFIL